MTKRDILIFLFKWQRHMLAMVLFITVVAVVLQYLSPQAYPAKSILLVEHNRVPTKRSDLAPGLQIIDVLNTEISIILSNTVIARAVDKIKPHERPKKPSVVRDIKQSIRSGLVTVGLADAATERDNWIRYLTKQVSVKAVVSSNIVRVQYSDEAPQWSAEIVNAIVESYIEHRIDIYTPAGTANVYRKQMEQIGAQLKAHRAELKDANGSENIGAADKLRETLMQQRSAILESIVSSQIDLADLKLRYQSEHSMVRSEQTRLDSYQSKVIEISAQLQSLEQQLSKTMQMRMNIDAEESLFQSYKRLYDEERLKELASPDLVNVRVVEFSEPAVRPKHSRLFYIVIAVFGGAILSLGIAFLLEYFDRRIPNGRAAEDILGVPELGSIPRF